jgi:hypothetical protein
MLQADVLLIIDSVDKLKDKFVFDKEKCRRRKYLSIFVVERLIQHFEC